MLPIHSSRLPRCISATPCLRVGSTATGTTKALPIMSSQDCAEEDDVSVLVGGPDRLPRGDFHQAQALAPAGGEQPPIGRQRVVAWAPDADFLVATQVNGDAPQLLDLRTGRAEAYAAPERSLSWSVAVGEGRMLAGSQNTATLMQHSRESNGTVAVTPLRQWQFASGSLSSGISPMLVNQGRRLVYPTSSNDLAWIELASGEQGLWAISSLRPRNFAKVGDHLVAFDVHNFGGAPVPTRVIDTEKARIAEAKGRPVMRSGRKTHLARSS
jgi:hypothetical protein